MLKLILIVPYLFEIKIVAGYAYGIYLNIS